ncbi:hypothetical protein GGR21_004302 [Dysgonomonas hofstadii]|uniref:Uncharacterized protein n=1 Tax=Dysgonomonas hofstadii TaxID=637886 RepID=A0A840D1Z0_9BACT|nr:hypothetical protein [Dysgonomonas hofstadii]
MDNKIRQRIILAFIILAYNAIGLFTVCSIMGSDSYYGDWTIWMSILTFPIIIISFIYRYIQAEPLYPIFIIQSIVLILTLYLGDFIIRRINNK